jgi:hypothetical protein
MTNQNSPVRNQTVKLISSTAPQSPIRVSNSILTPNTYHFSTKVSPANQIPWNNDNVQILLPGADQSIMGIRKSEMSLMESKYTNLLKKPHTKIGDDSISMSKTIPEDLDEAIEFDIDKQIDIYEVNYQDVIDSWINPEKKKKG